MMVENSLQNGRQTVIKKPHLMMQASEKKKNEMARAVKEKEDKAAVFAQSSKEDYSGKKLSPLQKGILDLRERILKIKEDESIGKEEKDKLLQDMNKQLKLMEDQLVKETEREMAEGKEEEDAANGVKKAEEKGGKLADKDQLKEGGLAQAMIGAGAGLERMDAMDGLAEKDKGRAKAAQRELDYAVNHPCPGNPEESSLRLHDKVIIDKKQDEINGLQDAAEALHGEMGRMLKEQEEDMEQVNAGGVKADEDEKEKAIGGLR